MRRRRWSQTALAAAGIVVGLLGAHRLMVTAAGKTSPAVVTEAMHFVNSSADETQFGYHVRYQFAVDGTEYVGSASSRGLRDIAKLPTVGSLIEVQYLPWAPFLNESAQTNPVPGLAIGSLGLLLVALSITLGYRRIVAAPLRFCVWGIA